ncbi:MAG: FeoA family protein [Candidatus Izemoplasma sp.]
MTITDLKKFDSAIIVSFNGISKEFRGRLMDIGIYENAHVTLLNRLSFGSLFLIEVDDIEICMRFEDAVRIEVVQ